MDLIHYGDWWRTPYLEPVCTLLRLGETVISESGEVESPSLCVGVISSTVEGEAAAPASLTPRTETPSCCNDMSLFLLAHFLKTQREMTDCPNGGYFILTELYRHVVHCVVAMCGTAQQPRNPVQPLSCALCTADSPAPPSDQPLL